jgi:hypothetical protein
MAAEALGARAGLRTVGAFTESRDQRPMETSTTRAHRHIDTKVALSSTDSSRSETTTPAGPRFVPAGVTVVVSAFGSRISCNISCNIPRLIGVSGGNPGATPTSRQQSQERQNRRLEGCLTCGGSGGQGRGRTADLPIFGRSFEAVDADLVAPLTADCCPRACYSVSVVKCRAWTSSRVLLDALILDKICCLCADW